MDDFHIFTSTIALIKNAYYFVPSFTGSCSSISVSTIPVSSRITLTAEALVKSLSVSLSLMSLEIHLSVHPSSKASFSRIGVLLIFCKAIVDNFIITLTLFRTTL